MTICDANTNFKHVTNITEDLLLNSIETNLKLFLDWSFLKIGGWFDAEKSHNNLYSNQYHTLKSVDVPPYLLGQVWEGIKKDWVWESDIEVGGRSPIAITEVSINNQILSTNFSINYELGRLILNDKVSVTSKVEVDHSYRYVQIYRANNAPWFSTIQYMDPSNKTMVDQLSSGDWKIGQNHTIQLPAIVIESLPRSRSKPHEIGSSGLIIEQDFAFHIIANNKNDRNKLIDILRLQQDLVIWLYDVNKLSFDNKYPIEYDGSLKENPLMYPDIISQYPWKKCWLRNINVFESESIDPNMHRATMRVTAEIIYT